MAIDPTKYYGTLLEAETYFGERLHETDYLGASTANKEKALLAATRAIDALRFAGDKVPVYDIKQVALAAGRDPTTAELEAADAEQLLQFPRDTQTEVPDAIKFATWEEAHSLLSGRDPSQERENLSTASYGVSSTRASLDVGRPSMDHLAHGITSWVAWRHLLPYLANDSSFTVSRSS